MRGFQKKINLTWGECQWHDQRPWSNKLTEYCAWGYIQVMKEPWRLRRHTRREFSHQIVKVKHNVLCIRVRRRERNKSGYLASLRVSLAEDMMAAWTRGFSARANAAVSIDRVWVKMFGLLILQESSQGRGVISIITEWFPTFRQPLF